MEAHERDCPFTMTVCGFPGCNEDVLRSELEARGTEAAANKHMQLVVYHKGPEGDHGGPAEGDKEETDGSLE